MSAPPTSAPITIAIDGPAASGKGTLADRLARHYDFACLHTGLLYRALADALLRQEKGLENMDVALDIAAHIGDLAFDDPAHIARLHQNEVGTLASELAAHLPLRANLMAYQRGFAAHPPQGKKGAILEGRDIGTVVLPDADIKIYITASLAARVERRGQQFSASTHDAIEREISDRDCRDQTRAISPLVKADDALLIDTTELSIDETFTQMVEIIDLARKRAKKGGI